MNQTDTKQKGQRKRDTSLVERDIRAYELHMNGNSIRAIGDEIGLKSSRSAWDAVNRGKKFVDEKGIDVQRRRVEIDQLFKNTLGALAAEVQRQVVEGRVQTIEHADGSKEVRRTKGIDPRTAEALARSADRWAQFLGLTDRGPEMSVVQISQETVNALAPLPKASYERWLASGGPGALTALPPQGQSSDRVIVNETDTHASM